MFAAKLKTHKLSAHTSSQFQNTENIYPENPKVQACQTMPVMGH
jgi:hypothetical protein